MKDENGNWVPIFKANNADISMTCGVTISEESEAALWAISEGGIEIVER